MEPDPIRTEEEQTQERRWLAWQRKNRAEEQQRIALRMRMLRWICILVLLLTAALWGRSASYAVFVRFAISGGSLWIMRRAYLRREYRWAAVFVGVAVAYNPVFPLFALAGSLAFGIVVGTALLFGASLVLESEPPEREAIHVV